MRTQIRFEKGKDKNVELEVNGASAVFVGETFAAAEEQIERTFESLWPPTFALVLLILSLVGGLLLFAPVGGWTLYKEVDLQRLQELAKAATTDSSKLDFLVECQKLRLEGMLASTRSVVDISSGRNVFVFLTFAAMVGMLAALVFKYPVALFAWGDMAGTHTALVESRKTLWNAFFGAIVLGLVINLGAAVIAGSP